MKEAGAGFAIERVYYYMFLGILTFYLLPQRSERLKWLAYGRRYRPWINKLRTDNETASCIK